MNSKVQIGWVDILPTENKAIIRFKEAHAASKVLEELKKEGKMVYEGHTLSGRCIEGNLLVSLSCLRTCYLNFLFALQVKKS